MTASSSTTFTLKASLLLVMGSLLLDPSSMCCWTVTAFAPVRSSSPTTKKAISLTRGGVPSSSSSSSSATALKAGAAVLYGHPGTRSPLVNWAAEEVGFELTMAPDLGKNPHPFGQLPCLEVVVLDDDDKDKKKEEDNTVVVFESGAILQYIHSKTNGSQSPSKQAAITSWITWANASLDPICFLETPEGKVYDTGLKRPQKRIDQLEEILTQQPFLTGKEFTVADVAVASYLLYALQFFPTLAPSLSRWPSMKQYMKVCASRPAYAKAFGKNVQTYLVEQLSEDSSEPTKKKILGMF